MAKLLLLVNSKTFFQIKNHMNIPDLSQPAQKQITLSQTASVKCDECANTTFTEAVIIRKASRILTGAQKDSYIPIPVYLCSACGGLNEEFIPAEVKAEMNKAAISL